MDAHAMAQTFATGEDNALAVVLIALALIAAWYYLAK